MRKIYFFIFSIISLFIFASCGSDDNASNTPSSQEIINSESKNNESSNMEESSAQSSTYSDEAKAIFMDSKGNEIKTLTGKIGDEIDYSKVDIPTLSGHEFISWSGSEYLITSAPKTMNYAKTYIYPIFSDIAYYDGIYFGKYPQTHIPSTEISNYSQEEYVTIKTPKENSSITNYYAIGKALNDGTVIKANTNYYFKLEPLRWKLTQISSKQYSLKCDTILDWYGMGATSSYEFKDTGLYNYLNNNSLFVFTNEEKEMITSDIIVPKFPGTPGYKTTRDDLINKATDYSIIKGAYIRESNDDIPYTWYDYWYSTFEDNNYYYCSGEKQAANTYVSLVTNYEAPYDMGVVPCVNVDLREDVEITLHFISNIDTDNNKAISDYKGIIKEGSNDGYKINYDHDLSLSNFAKYDYLIEGFYKNSFYSSDKKYQMDEDKNEVYFDDINGYVYEYNIYVRFIEDTSEKIVNIEYIINNDNAYNDFENPSTISSLATFKLFDAFSMNKEDKFLGWYYDSEFMYPCTILQNQKKDFKLYAKWGKYSDFELNCNIEELDDGTLEISKKDTFNLSELIIPSEFEGKAITSIKEGGFSGCTSIYKLELPIGLLHINKNAFYNCSNISELIIPESVVTIGDASLPNRLKKLEGSLYTGNERILKTLMGFGNNDTYYNCPIEELILHNTTQIASYAFEGLKNLVKVEMPNNVTFIGDEAFANCVNLENINLTSNINHIITSAFDGCNKLSFNKVGNVEHIEINNNPHSILLRPFKNKTSILLLKDVDLIADKILTNVTKIYYEGTDIEFKNVEFAYFDKDKVKNCTIYYFTENGASEEREGNFWYFDDNNEIVEVAQLDFILSSDSSYYILNSLGKIDTTNLIVPSYYLGLPVKAINANAFSNTNVLELTLPKSIISIDQNAFKNSKVNIINCDSTTIKYIPSFTTLEEINVISGTEIEAEAFKNVASVIKKITLNESINTFGRKAFSGCSLLKELNIPANVKALSKDMFFNCTSLENIELPSELETIGSYAFYNCSSLKYLYIPSSITSISTDAFFGNCGIKELITPIVCSIPENLETLEIYGDIKLNDLYNFSGAYVSNLKLTGNINTITSGCLKNFTSLRSLTMKYFSLNKVNYGLPTLFNNNIPNTLREVTVLSGSILTKSFETDSVIKLTLGKDVTEFKGALPDNIFTLVMYSNINIPYGSRLFEVYNLSEKERESNLYQIYTSLDEPSKIIVDENMGMLFRKIDNYYNLVGVLPTNNKITIPTTYNDLPIKEVADYALYKNSNITEVTIADDGIEKINYYSFCSMSNLTKIYIGSNVEFIGSYAIDYCPKLNTVTFSESSKLKTIKDGAFASNESLTSITLPESVEVIEANAFSHDNFTSFTFPKNVNVIADHVLDKNPNLEEVVFEGNITEIGESAFSKDELLKKKFNVIIPSSIITIKDYAFENAGNAINDLILTNIKTIGSAVFNKSEVVNVELGLSFEQSTRSFNHITNLYYDGTLDNWNNLSGSKPNGYADNFYVLDENGTVEFNGIKYSLVTE